MQLYAEATVENSIATLIRYDTSNCIAKHTTEQHEEGRRKELCEGKVYVLLQSTRNYSMGKKESKKKEGEV